MVEEWRVNYVVRPGGLMRCCLATLCRFMESDATKPPEQGDKLHCMYDHSFTGAMIFRDGAWEWDQKPAWKEGWRS